MSRVENTTKNAVFSTASLVLSTVLSFVARTIFIQTLGTAYLGVNSLFINILSMLSLTELGIGAAINFSLYKPLADKDTEKVKSLMHFYRKAYLLIAVVVSLLGLAIYPFLGSLIKGGEGIRNIPLIYFIYLFNSANSYLFSYKRTLLAADQKSYLIVNISMATSLVLLGVQTVALLLFSNYLLYLIPTAVIGILQNLFINRYINRQYPYLLQKDIQPLATADRQLIIKNVKAMVLHKIGDLSINQTDNLIISSMIHITTVGLLSNYVLVMSTINMLVTNILNAASASLGNLLATEGNERKLAVFNGYNFLAFWFFGWTAVCFHAMLNPFIILWLGPDKTIDPLSLNLIVFNYFMVGMRIPLGNFKAAAGVYAQDRFAPIVQSVINLAVSVVGARLLGLPGVFIGTVVSSLAVPFWHRPIIVYKHVFNASSKLYFRKYAVFMVIFILNAFAVSRLSAWLFRGSISWFTLIGTGFVCMILPNAFVWVMFRSTSEYAYIRSIFARSFRKVEAHGKALG